MEFPKPSFSVLLDDYRVDPGSIHSCPSLGSGFNTCAIRMSEALVLANGLARDRAEIASLRGNDRTGRSLLLGLYEYQRNLCPHGLARGAQDLAAFLRQHWGNRNMGWAKPGRVPQKIMNTTGVIAFFDIPSYSGQGHIDLWNRTAAVGSAYWDAKVIWYWTLA